MRILPGCGTNSPATRSTTGSTTCTAVIIDKTCRTKPPSFARVGDVNLLSNCKAQAAHVPHSSFKNLARVNDRACGRAAPAAQRGKRPSAKAVPPLPTAYSASLRARLGTSALSIFRTFSPARESGLAGSSTRSVLRRLSTMRLTITGSASLRWRDSRRGNFSRRSLTPWQ